MTQVWPAVSPLHCLHLSDSPSLSSTPSPSLPLLLLPSTSSTTDSLLLVYTCCHEVWLLVCILLLYHCLLATLLHHSHCQTWAHLVKREVSNIF